MKTYKIKDGFTSIFKIIDKKQGKSNNLLENLLDTKRLIDKYSNEWDIIKRINHDYEYIYTSSNPYKNISSIIPVSRSYFKLIEMIYEYDFFSKGDMSTVACLAEAPGGFIQSILDVSNKNNFDKKIHSITLVSNDYKVPYWNPLLVKHKDIHLYAGQDGTGDLFKLSNVLHFIKSVGRESCDLVTGDGGFDYSNDYDNQEINSLPLIFSEIFIAINIQKIGGNFVCKLFDIFHSQTRQLLYILYLCYSDIYFHKPDTSRFSNSEKYIICKGFKGFRQDISNYMCHNFNKYLSLYIPHDFSNELDIYNVKYVEKQIQSIKMGIAMIHNKSKQTKQSYESQIKIAVAWCKKYKVPLNTKFIEKVFPKIDTFSRWD